MKINYEILKEIIRIESDIESDNLSNHQIKIEIGNLGLKNLSDEEIRIEYPSIIDYHGFEEIRYSLDNI